MREMGGKSDPPKKRFCWERRENVRLDGWKGNEALKRQLAGPVQLPQACIIAGPPGSGRHTLVRLLAQALVCTNPALEARPCGQCRHCRKAAEGIHPDIIWVDQFTGPEDRGAEVKIAAARALRQDAYIRPNEAERKAYLIDRPLNGNAQNALLKLLEDGPDYAAFLLLTDNAASLLETVRSRCLLFQTTPPEEETSEDDLPVQWGARWVEALCTGGELPLMEWAVELQTEKVDRETLEQVYQELIPLLVQALTPSRAAGPLAAALARALPGDRLAALARLAEEARSHCQYNVSVGHSAGWFAVRSRQIALGQ